MDIAYKLVHEASKWEMGSNLDQVAAKQDTLFVVAKQDWIGMQLLVQNPIKSILKTSGIATFSPYGALPSIRVEACVEGIDEANITTKLIGYIQDDDQSYKPDLLLTQEYITLEADTIGAVWIEVQVPNDISAGIYEGTIRVTCQEMFQDEAEVGCIPFTIEVKDVILEKAIDSKFHLDLWQHNCNIARKHEVHCYSEEHFRILEDYIKSMAELGQKVAMVVMSEIPWLGQCCYDVKDYPSDLFEYNIVNIKKDQDGMYHYDFDALKRYIELCFKYGINKEIELVGLASVWGDKDTEYGNLVEGYGDFIRLRYYDETSKTYKYITSLDDVKAYIEAVANFFRTMGWMELVRIVADEPSNEEVYKEAIALIRGIDSGFKFKAAINSVDFIRASKETVTDFIPMLPIVTNQWDQIQDVKSHIEGKLYYYVCCAPTYPNTFIVSPLAECRLIGIVTSLLGLDGFLRWNYTVWPEDPRNRLSYKYDIWKAGDTNFVYPSRGGRPLLSLRYKLLKRGIEDYSLLERVKEKLGKDPERIKEIFGLIFNPEVIENPVKFYQVKEGEAYTVDYNQYELLKRTLLDILED